MMGFPVGPDDAACISIFKKEDEMARPAIDIIQDAKRKIEKRRKDFRPAPFYDASQAADLCDPANYLGNNKSEYIHKLATAAAYIICEIETIQAIKGDGIIQ